MVIQAFEKLLKFLIVRKSAGTVPPSVTYELSDEGKKTNRTGGKRKISDMCGDFFVRIYPLNLFTSSVLTIRAGFPTTTA